MSENCIVLAGGLGTRLKQVVPDAPKCLAPINGEPFLKLQLEQLARFGISNFILALGFGADLVISELSNDWAKKFKISYFVEESPLGTGGALKHVFKKNNLEESLVINGDTIISGDFSGMLTPLNFKGGELARLAAINVPNRGQFGGLVIDGSKRVDSFLEKGLEGPGLINAGIYRLHKKIFFDSELSFSLENLLLPLLVCKGQLYAYSVSGIFFDIGTPESYKSFCNFQVITQSK
jgi:D-glycero-alpha-D-manno-heptose 1-phosphate guanylyltransferase